MDFALTAEQIQLRDSVRKMVEKHGAAAASAEDYGRAWSEFAALGGPGLCVSDYRGGYSGAPEDIVIVACELGRASAGAPRIDTAVVAARLLEAAAGEAANGLLQRFIAGQVQPAYAALESPRDFALHHIASKAVAHDRGYRLSGRKIAVVGGETADLLLVAAQVAYGSHGPSTFGLFTIEDAAGAVTRHGYRLIDGTPVADIVLDGTDVPPSALLPFGPAARGLLEDAIDAAVLAACAASLGSMERAIELTIDYLKLRQQFGRPLADNQALQHQVADLFVVATEARSSVYAAIAALAGPRTARMCAISACKVKVASAARRITGQAVHLHGGIGFTTEYAVGHHYRRALVDEMMFGDVDYHLDRHVVLSRHLDEPQDRSASACESVEAIV